MLCRSCKRLNNASVMQQTATKSENSPIMTSMLCSIDYWMYYLCLHKEHWSYYHDGDEMNLSKCDWNRFLVRTGFVHSKEST